MKNLSDALQEEIQQGYSYFRTVSKVIYAETESKNPPAIKTNLDSENYINENIKQKISSGIWKKEEKLVQMIQMRENGRSI
ncbi:hypothetical protein [Sphingobacterium bovisgrunnientis]|uniref:hypothetical protein n=1 Tax=Sphingobacterium bovisgrunnientis TaxID=1874697 RepID=UPI001356C716|nr:hypothetical protein [Sphingobacterium bovisgrunnientis]